METVTLSRHELDALLTRASKEGAKLMMNEIAVYHMKDAARLLNMSYNTLQKRINEGKIKPVDGRITGAEINRYLGVK